MPGRNLEKIYIEHGYYHVYSRGVNKDAVFRCHDDYRVFLNLFKRYLDSEPSKDPSGREYPWLHNDIQLLAYCLMPNHFHAYIYQVDLLAMTKLFKSIITTYGMYFNKKYDRKGPVFQSRFRAVLTDSNEYLQHITRYIHLNPKDYRGWQYSSLPYYMGKQSAGWVHPQPIIELFNNDPKAYMRFLMDYRNYKDSLVQISYLLADN